LTADAFNAYLGCCSVTPKFTCKGTYKMRAQRATKAPLTSATHVTFGSKAEMARAAPCPEFVVREIRRIVRGSAELKRLRQRAGPRVDDRRDELAAKRALAPQTLPRADGPAR
jgi:hypothetical protein